MHPEPGAGPDPCACIGLPSRWRFPFWISSARSRDALSSSPPAVVDQFARSHAGNQRILPGLRTCPIDSDGRDLSEFVLAVNSDASSGRSGRSSLPRLFERASPRLSGRGVTRCCGPSRRSNKRVVEEGILAGPCASRDQIGDSHTRMPLVGTRLIDVTFDADHVTLGRQDGKDLDQIAVVNR